MTRRGTPRNASIPDGTQTAGPITEDERRPFSGFFIRFGTASARSAVYVEHLDKQEPAEPVIRHDGHKVVY